MGLQVRAGRLMPVIPAIDTLLDDLQGLLWKKVHCLEHADARERAAQIQNEDYRAELYEFVQRQLELSVNKSGCR